LFPKRIFCKSPKSKKDWGTNPINLLAQVARFGFSTKIDLTARCRLILLIGMAGLLTHAWIAHLVLQKLSKKDFISKSENIDDYFFGSVAPDIRYVSNSSRDITHQSLGEKSIFEALKVNNYSAPFMAGYETHLVTDETWSNDNGLLDESIYEHFNIDTNNPVQKFSLYLLVDDYFQGEADRFFPVTAASNIVRANDIAFLVSLGFNQNTIAKYNTYVATYLREPGIDTLNAFNFFPSNFEESALKTIVDQLPAMSDFLKEFKKNAIEQSVLSLERYL
jgi:hypothetical protein